LEQTTTLSFLAAKTTSLHLVTSIMVLPYRHPLLAAKMLASLDVLSGGRLILGVGVGWMKEEFEALGLHSFEERGVLSNEYIRILREVWTSEKPSFRGKFFSFEDLKLGPLPIQKPHPPIWVGGESEAALRRAAALGDAWYPIGGNPKRPLKTLSQLREAISKLNTYGRSSGRIVDIPVSLVAFQPKLEEGLISDELFVGDPQKVISDIHDCERLGVSYVSFDFLGQNIDETIHSMDRFAEQIIGQT
jgi:probable F420-dependent oxidoreductase